MVNDNGDKVVSNGSGMNELKNFKEKKLAEFDDKYCRDSVYYKSLGGVIISIEEIREFISDLIDDIEKAIPERNNIPVFNQLREDMLNKLNN
jgi:sugar-specific transcriptional regulator TrmB